MPGTGEDWRWCFAAISAGDTVRYSPVWAARHPILHSDRQRDPGLSHRHRHSYNHRIDLESLSNTKPVDKTRRPPPLWLRGPARECHACLHQFTVANPSGYHTHSNGGGIVGPTATVASTAYVGPNCQGPRRGPGVRHRPHRGLRGHARLRRRPRQRRGQRLRPWSKAPPGRRRGPGAGPRAPDQWGGQSADGP